jgi:peptidoglycan-associated lipoprotein
MVNFKQRIILGAAALATVLTLAACGSKVKLDETKVSDAQPVAVTPSGATSTTPSGTQSGVASRDVSPVTVASNPNDAAGPAGAARVILFDYDSFAIKPEYQGAIDTHARFLNANKGRKMAIDGHTDERGGREYNLALGQKRAEAVRRALMLLGVADSQMEAVSFGEEKPADAASSEDAWAKNRRAELNYR